MLAFYGADAIDSFEALRVATDPSGIFLNGYLTARGLGPKE